MERPDKNSHGSRYLLECFRRRIHEIVSNRTEKLKTRTKEDTMDKKHILSSLNQFTHHHFGCMLSQATEQQAYRALCFYIKDILVQRNRQFAEDSKNKGRKQVYYMSMEFLIGTSLRNNLFNLGLEQTIGEIFDELGMDLQAVYTLEPDAGLGNGGLGRLAACYMDAMTG
ncbi:MAG TPA: hypothetical protein DER23_04015, partial [Clostridiales bacterium]|nr:hypothetical protein [Clostridiales bacterium]